MPPASKADAAAAVEAQILELVEGYHRILNLHKAEQDEAELRPWRDDVGSASRRRSTRRITQQGDVLRAGQHNRRGNCSPTFHVDNAHVSVKSNDRRVAKTTAHVRSAQQHASHPTTRPRSGHVGVLTATRGTHRATSSTPLEETLLRLSAASAKQTSASPPRTASSTALRSTKRVPPKAHEHSSGFIRAQMHTCRGGRRGTSVLCAACNGMASVQHVRFLEGERIHQHNLREAIRDGLFQVVVDGSAKRRIAAKRRNIAVKGDMVF
jgi:hypothetical protein